MPIHPAIVHFPIALLMVAGGFYAYRIFREDPFFDRAGWLLHIMGLLGMVAAILSGRQASGETEITPSIQALLDNHEIIGYVATWWLSMLLIWVYLRKDKFISWERILFTALFCGGLALIAYSSHIGGQMVFEQGAGVQLP